MAINTMEYAKIFMEALDGQLVEGATTGWMEANAGQVQYSGGNYFYQAYGEITNVKDIVGDSGEIVVTMSAKIANMLDLAKGGSHVIESGEFRQGDAILKVRSIDGSPIIRVPSARLKTAFDFHDGVTPGKTDGGFEEATSAKNINWIIAVRHAPIAVSKTDVTRIFDPLTNQKANAWKIDYRKYHDLWIPDNAMDGIWVNVDGE